MSLDRPDRRDRRNTWGRAVGLVLSLALAACGGDEPTELDRTHAYMDSLRQYLGDLRLMDHELGEVVTTDTVEATTIVPIIAGNLHPTVSDLLERARQLQPTPEVAPAHALLISYLETRLEAYDAALQGNNAQRPDLFQLFARKQVEAQEIGRQLEDEAQRLRTQVPEYR